MPASSSVMLWEIGEYWGMGHFQNNGAAGGLGLRHPYARTAFNRLIPLGYFPQMLWISCFINDGVYFPLAIDITI